MTSQFDQPVISVSLFTRVASHTTLQLMSVHRTLQAVELVALCQFSIKKLLLSQHL